MHESSESRTMDGSGDGRKAVRRVVLDGEPIQLSGRRVCGTESWRAFRRLTKAGYLRAVWLRGPLRGMEYHLTATGEARVAVRLGRLP